MLAKVLLRCALAGAAAGSLQLAALAQATGGTPINVPGFLKFEAWNGLSTSDNSLDATLLADPRYPGTPDLVTYTTAFDSRPVYPNDSHEGYGGKMSGFITPLETGNYRFFIYSDDSSRLFLSTDDNPANLSGLPIAEETSCCNTFTEPDSPRTSEPVNLVAGRRYYVEMIWKEGNGGDYAQVAWRNEGDPTPAGSLRPIPGAFLSAAIPAAGEVRFTLEPASVTAAQNDYITLTTEVAATLSPLVIQWQKNGVKVPRLTGKSVRIGPLSASDNNAKFRAVASIPGAVATSSEATITVTADVTPPTIANVTGTDTFDTVTVDFSEAVTAASAGSAANYSLDGGLTVTAATIVSPTQVKLTTSRQTPGSTYTLTIKDIVDTAGQRSAADTKKSFPAFVSLRGGLKFEAFSGISSTSVDTLVDDPKYQANTPDEVGYVTQFTSRLIYPDSSHENYGGRISGWIVPPETGEYEFFLRSDDNSRLFLSADDTPENAQLIAEETGCCGAFEEPGAPETSAPQSLTSGRRYYIYALWKEGGGGDYLDVAWRKIGNTTPPRSLPYIPGSVLETYAAPGTFTFPEVALSSPAPGSSFDTGAPVTLTAIATAAAGKSVTRVEFFEGAREVGEATSSPYSVVLTDLSADSHTFVARVTDSAGLYTDSAPVNITVGVPVEKIALVAIDDKTSWRYDRSGLDLGTEWRALNYNDSSWPQGPALIADETTTTVEPIRTPISRLNDAGEYVKTFYFRTRFTFAGAVTPGIKLQLRHVVDDGAVLYLNGTEIHRFGIAEGEVDATTDASGHENAWEGPYDVPVSLLRQGENVLSAEVHQSGGSSSDMVFGAELVATVPVVPEVLNLVAIDDATTWRYDRSGQDLGTEWREKNFNDSQWPPGKALIADETTTTVEPIRTPISRLNDAGEYVKTFYFRTHFNFPRETTAGAKLRLRHVVDDGAVFYLNGVEIHRFGIAEGPIDASTDASGHENAYEGPYDIPLDALVPGDNVLAAEVHQSGGSSSDMVFGAELVVTLPGGGTPVPPTRPTFGIPVLQGGQLVISWSGTGTLQSAPSVTGPWTDVPNATTPYTVTSLSDGIRLYRLR